MSDVPNFHGCSHQEGFKYRVDQAYTYPCKGISACHLYQFPHAMTPSIMAIGHNQFATRQECADWIEANLPGVSVEWNVQQCFLPGIWGAPLLEKPWL